ncbi:MAG: peptidase C39 family protein [Oligoflexia bacterium]|nr:peptidase C39 family protein [Oligoflexia bacterium]
MLERFSEGNAGLAKLDVPFLINAKLDCGPIALAMVSAYFGVKTSLERIQELVVAETSGATWTLGLAAAAAELGLSVSLFSRSLGVRPENFSLDYYREHAAGVSEAEAKLTVLANRCRKFGGHLEERQLSLNELFALISSGAVPVMLIDWAKVVGKPNYIGHFVPLVGYNDSDVYIHNPGPDRAEPFMPLSHDLFELARKSPGTDEDILVVWGKRK